MILSIDAASTELSLALSEPDGTLVRDEAWTSAQRQSAELLPRLLELLERSDRALADVSALAVGTGPGSFTGLRVAMALAKGLATGLGRPLVGVPSLAAWLDAEPDAVAAVARAGARDAYLLVRGADEIRIVDREHLTSRSGPLVAADELAASFGMPDARPPRAAAAIAARAAARLIVEPDGDDLRTLEPIYLRAPRGVTAAATGGG